MSTAASSTLQFTELGIPTDPSEITSALHALWKENETATRASLMNLAIYSEAEGSLESNTLTVRKLTLEHACRVLLIEARLDLPDKLTEAWVMAHCSLGPDGRKAVCCEQLAFRMHGFSQARLTNLLYANLDSDLPLSLWWQAPLSGSFDQGIYSQIDRLIVDSHAWINPQADFERLRTIYADRTQHFVIHDLNWTRTFYLRLAIAAGFEDARILTTLPSMHAIEITHAKGHGITAHLLGAWLIDRLEEVEPSLHFIESQDDTPVQRVTFLSDHEPITCQYENGFYHWHDYSDQAHRRFPADGNDLSELIIEQLGRGGNNAVYLRIVRRAMALA